MKAPGEPELGVLPELSVLIVSYDTKELTLSCLDALERTASGLSLETIVVDNASRDGSPEAIVRRHPRVHVVSSPENLGFARATNRAARLAEGEHLLLLNPDTELRAGALQGALELARLHPEAGIVGGRTLFPDGSLNPSSCWGAPTLWSLLCHATGLASLLRRNRFFDPESLGSWPRDSVRRVDIVSGCFLLIRRELWLALGGFDEAFFMYGEDADLCLRARAAGHACMITPAAELVHHGGASERSRPDKLVRLFRAKAQLFAKHWPRARARTGARLLGLWALSRMLAFRALSFASARSRERARTWSSVWSRRREWLDAVGGTRSP